MTPNSNFLTKTALNTVQTLKKQAADLRSMVVSNSALTTADRLFCLMDDIEQLRSLVDRALFEVRLAQSATWTEYHLEPK